MSAWDDPDAIDEAPAADADSALDYAGEPSGASEPGSQAPVDSLRGLISFLVANLVDEPAAADIDVEQHGSAVQIRVNVPEEELGKIIGRGGRIAKAMRTALMIAGSRHHLRVSLDIEGKAA